MPVYFQHYEVKLGDKIRTINFQVRGTWFVFFLQLSFATFKYLDSNAFETWQTSLNSYQLLTLSRHLSHIVWGPPSVGRICNNKIERSLLEIRFLLYKISILDKNYLQCDTSCYSGSQIHFWLLIDQLCGEDVLQILAWT